MQDCAAPRSAVIVAMPDDIDYGRADQLFGQIRAAFAAGAPVVIADFTITTFCDCAVMQRMLACHAAAARLVPLPRIPRRGKPGDSGTGSRR
jgi:hypothetical protein